MKIARRIPGARFLYRTLEGWIDRHRLAGRSAEAVFTDIYRNNRWRGRESVSGTGSDEEQTRVLRRELESVISRLKVRRLLDVPCGDFRWMRHVRLEGVEYIGGDIVAEVVANNQRLYGNSSTRFERIDLLSDEIPRADLIFCRDCLVHLSFDDALRALDRMIASGATYLATTTFIHRDRNTDILTGQWRPLNLALEPFSFPEPLQLFVEECTEGDGIYADKAVGVWRIDDLRDRCVTGRRKGP